MDDAPDATAEKSVIFGRILFIYRNVFQPEVGKLRLIEVPLNIQAYSDFVDYCVAAPLSKDREYLLCFIWPYKIVSEDVLNIVHAFLNDLWIIRAAILSQKELQDINGDIRPFFYFLCLIFADNLPIEMLPQF